MKNILIVGSLFIPLLWLPANAHAVIVSGLYEVEIAVSSQSINSRAGNIAKALRAVLVKLTGDSQVASHRGVAELLDDADRYVQQFEYRHEEASGESQLVLWTHFNEFALDDVLHRLDIPQWGRERPITLVWLALDDVGSRRLVSMSNLALYIEKMTLHAHERGIVLFYPLLDLEDNQKLSSSDVWGDFHAVVLAASKRYHTDIVVTGKIETIIAGKVVARWLAHINGKILSWVTRGNGLDVVLMKGVDDLADILARQYGQVGEHTQSDEVEIIVKGISDYDQYTKVLNYLSLLNSVMSVDVQQIMEESVTYILMTEVDSAVVSKAIALGDTVEEIGNNAYRLVQ